jgi:hypothetical protein
VRGSEEGEVAIDARLQKVAFVVCVGRVIEEGGGYVNDLRRVSESWRTLVATSSAYMVESVGLEHFVPQALVGVVPDHNNVDVFLPLGMDGVYLIGYRGSTDGCRHLVPGVE